MRYINLPWLSSRLGRPVLVAVPTLLDREEPVPPPDALLLSIQWPTAEEMMQVPGAVPGGECYDRLGADEQIGTVIAWEQWMDGFLAKAVERPSLTISDVQRLGPDRRHLAVGLLRLSGWAPREDGTFEGMPSEPFAEALRLLSRKTRRLPSELLAMSFPEFVFNFRILQSAQAAVSESDVMEAISG